MPAKKKENAPAPFSTAPLDWIRAGFEAAKATARTGSKDGLPRALLSHATMRRLRIAVGERILLLGGGGVQGSLRKIEPGQAVGIEDEPGKQDSVTEAMALLSTCASCVVLAWPSSSTPAISVALEQSILTAINIEEGAKTFIIHLSLLPTAIPSVASLTLSPSPSSSPVDFDFAAAGPITTLSMMLQLQGRCVCNGHNVTVSLNGSPCTLQVSGMHRRAGEEGGGGGGGGGEEGARKGGQVSLFAMISQASAVHVQQQPHETRHEQVQEEEDNTIAPDGGGGGGGGGGGLAVRVQRALQTVETMVGGMEEVVREVIEGVSSGLFQAEEYHKYNLSPPRGILLYGPPGTGKTLLAKTVSEALRVQLLCVDAPELIGGYYGDCERKVRDLFARARSSAPVIVFFDEIDVVSSSRDRASGEMERRVVSALVQELDRLQGRGSDPAPNLGSELGASGNLGIFGESVGHSVVVIGATNRVEELDASLRLPGRFDLEIQMPVPTSRGRRSILEILLRDAPHQLSADHLTSVAATMHGCVGADIELAVTAATVAALRRSELDGSPMSIVPADMQRAAASVKPSALREVLVEVPNVKWSDIGGQAEAKQALTEAVEWPLKYPEAFERMGIRPPAGVLLYGPPGCSKTLMAKALATEASLNFIAVKGPELFRKYVGDSEKAVAATFRRARQAAPSIVFFDEIDALAVDRGSSGDSSASQRVVSQLLNEMDGVNPLRHVLVVAATNRPDLLDTAFVRPGRIDRLIYVAPPDLESRKAILDIYLSRMPTKPCVDVKMLAGMCEGFSGAELANVCREAAMQAIGRGEDEVGMEALQAAVTATKPRITAEMLAFYRGFAAKHAQPSCGT